MQRLAQTNVNRSLAQSNMLRGTRAETIFSEEAWSKDGTTKTGQDDKR